MPSFKLGWTIDPGILGYEWPGTVSDVGSAVSEFLPGDQVTGDVSIGCGHCVNCMRGLYNIRVTKQEAGLCRGKDGALRNFSPCPLSRRRLRTERAGWS